MSQYTPSLIPKRNSLRAPDRARLTKRPSALSLRSAPISNISTPPSSSKLSTPSPATTTTTTTTTAINKATNRLSTHSLRSLVRKKSTHSLVSCRNRGISPSPSISAPTPPTKLLRLSEILDPEDMIREHRSLSGTPAPGTPLSPTHSDGDFPGLQPADSGGEAKRLIIHSPSGAKLDAEEFLKRKDRPLTLGERQQKIREETKKRADEARREGLERAMRKEGKRECCCVM
ncbi:MAG: hypothetical protein Q9209_005061 [Squamulea sp. 1 TL-2023]